MLNQSINHGNTTLVVDNSHCTMSQAAVTEFALSNS